MPARAIWKAVLVLGDARVPVRLYSAVQDVRVRFRLLHQADLAPVTQRMVDPNSGRVVPREEIQRGLELEEGVLVVLRDEERAEIAPRPSREIRVEQVIPRAGLDPRFRDRPYHLGPDGDDDAYFALAAELEERDGAAVARWVMRKRSTCGVLEARDGRLRLSTTHATEQVVPLGRFTAPPQRAPDPRELALAEQLVRALEGPFDPADYPDETQRRVRELVAAKARGEALAAAEPAPPPPPDRSLLDQLQASLAGGQEAAGAP